MVIPPVVESARQAYHPYTAAGKQELCATHLRSVAQALATYAQDYEGRYPPLDYQNAQAQRTTWVSLVSGRAAQGDLSCPVRPAVDSTSANLTSSFVLNQAGVAYADGHASVLSSGSPVTDAALWGGSAVLRRSRDRLSQSRPQAREFLKRLQVDNVVSAASYLKANRTARKPVSDDLLALWRLNTGEQTSGVPTSDSMEKLGWNLAQAWQKAGDSSFKKQCDEEQTRLSQAAVETINSGTWEQRQVTGQPAIRCEAPSGWTFEVQQEDRYCRLYLRSRSPALYALLEVGNCTKYVNPQPINWDGEEKELRRRYKGDYRRLNRGLITMNGQTASVWEYELEKPGLRQRLGLVEAGI